MTLSKETIIGELVAQNYRAASVFKKHGIDFCCQGNRTIENACKKKNIDANTIVEDLKNVNKSQPTGNIDYNSWPLDLLADYIEKKHHRYVEAAIMELKPYLARICQVHGERHPELLEINKHFLLSAAALSQHMKKEELVLFPYVRKIVKSQSEQSIIDAPHFGTVQNPIQMMMNEHEVEGERFREIEALTNNYTPPEDACNTYRVTFALLQEFEEDLHLHIHLENNILFPNAIKLEQKFAIA